MTYLGGPYYPWWLDNLADDVIGDGAAFEHPAQGADAVRMIVLAARDLYDQHKVSFIGDYDDRFLEEYTCQIRGEPTSAVVTVTRDNAGNAQQIVVNHRPLRSVLLFARLMEEKLTGTDLAAIFSSRVP
jgi:xanthine dehydrogenase molybdopterin-binding subunit B